MFSRRRVVNGSAPSLAKAKDCREADNMMDVSIMYLFQNQTQKTLGFRISNSTHWTITTTAHIANVPLLPNELKNIAAMGCPIGLSRRSESCDTGGSENASAMFIANKPISTVRICAQRLTHT